jgi:hypothetical protein
MEGRIVIAALLAVAMAPPAICLQPNPDFSGTWIQSNERSIPRRMNNVTLHIEHRDPELTIETTISRGSGSPRRAVQRYTTDGKESISTGADGDEFHTSIVWKNQTAVFSIEEHEDGRILLSRETWTLLENGTALERVREPLNASPDEPGKQTIVYLRQAPQN